MQIKSLYIHNYKSFYDTTIEFDKFNIIVAPNNAGKSNLIDVLEFINIALEYDIERAIKDKGGIDNIKNYKNDEEKIVIKVCYKDEEYNKIKLTISKKYVQLTLFKNKNYFVIEKKQIGDKYSFTKVRPNSTTFYFFFTKIYYFHPEIIKQKSHLEAEEEFQRGGNNLGKNLAYIKNYDKENSTNNFEKISNSLIGIVEEIDAIDVTPIAGQYILTFKEQNRDININIISDGTINLIATITALNQPDYKNFILAFEEPERHLHLKAVNYLLDEFRNHEKQILITTHSTEILNSAKIEELIFMYRDSYGDTKTIRADKIKGLKNKLKRLGSKKDLSISELIDENILGDLEDYE